jgi:hypothetical protein
MPDGALKLQAFEVILRELLADNRAGLSATEVARPTSAPTPKAPASVRDRILVLRAEGFFVSERGLGEIRDELRVRGWPYQLTSLSGPLQSLVQRRELRRAKVSNGKLKSYKYVQP